VKIKKDDFLRRDFSNENHEIEYLKNTVLKKAMDQFVREAIEAKLINPNINDFGILQMLEIHGKHAFQRGWEKGWKSAGLYRKEKNK